MARSAKISPGRVTPYRLMCQFGPARIVGSSENRARPVEFDKSATREDC
jgi:hypothetical protein